ncbi:MAG: hypothetical protein AAGH65_08720, partial [Pseudomonadota bacterium]
MIRFLLLTVSLMLASVSMAHHDEAHTDEVDKPSFSANRSMTVSANVIAIDHDTREVSLERADGSMVSFTAGPEVRNLAQVQPGDQVVAEMMEEISIQVYANPDDLPPGAGEIVAEARAEEGAMPGAGVVDTMVITAVVEAIDTEANTFKLRFSDDDVREFEAANPANLERSEVG